MSNERWQQVETLYHEALEQDSGARAAFLAQACAADEELRREVETLLSYDKRGRDFIERPALELEARAMAAESPEAELLKEVSQAIAPSQIGPYRLLEPIGKGGMGEVHLALDTRLQRKVAIKLLPAEFTADLERVQRFQQEARAVSALNHPNIVTVYEIGEVEGRHYIVTEYVEGETLRQRMTSAAQQQVKLEETVKIATQVTGALETAHAAGIIHRDIKPENVMVRKDGLVKVLDFGLAKIRQMQDEAQFSSPERVSTRSGIVMGTVTYMSPEQARGEKVDHRTDIFSLGVILYEMLAGRKPFEGTTAGNVIVAVLTSDPQPLAQLVPKVPAASRRIVERCLEKKPEKRFQSAGDLAFALESLISPSVLHPGKVAALLGAQAKQRAQRLGQRAGEVLSQVRLRWIIGTVAAAFFIATATLSVIHLREQPERTLAASFSFSVPENWKFQWYDAPAVSPDGRFIVFNAAPISAEAGRTMSLWIRALNSTEAKMLPNTEDGIAPFWSPDGRFVAFWANGQLRKVDISNDAVTTICETPASLTGTWNQDGIILFAGDTKISRVAANGGPVANFEPFADGETIQSNPHFLPDGKHFLYFSRNRESQNNGLYVASLDVAKTRKLVLKSVGRAVYLSPGYLLFAKDNKLFAQPFDLQKLEVMGSPVQVADRVESHAVSRDNVPFAAFSVSDNGVLVWKVATSEAATTQLTWFNRSGNRLRLVGEPARYSGPALSPDEKRLVVAQVDAKTRNRDLWIINLVSGNSTRLTFDPGDELNPVWSSDGKWILFTAARKGARNLYRKLADGSGEEELLLESEGDKNVEDISPDGRFLLFNFRTPGNGEPGLAFLSLIGDRQPKILISRDSREDQALFSPNGRWVAHRSSQNGNIFVRRFTGDGNLAGGQWQVSNNGGSQPRWRGDGKELFYLKGNSLMAVEVNTDGPTFSAGTPKPLFNVNIEAEERRNRYLVTKDGQNFLVVAVKDAAGGGEIAVQTNWLAGLK